MAEKLQGLLEKIKTEGLEKAEAEKHKILEEARQEAAGILKKAGSEADGIIKKAEGNAADLKKRSETAVSQAARDIMLKLKTELRKRLENIVRRNIADCMTPEFMGKITAEMAAAFCKNQSGEDVRLELLVAPKDLEKMTALLQGSMAETFKNAPEVFGSGELGSGLKIGFKGQDVFFDFSDDAISDLVCAYVSPKLAEILKTDDAEK
ncbi:MAG: hypothetical protein PHV59_04580 [Victivallales bacterium]|nr:hypothetical protein [Victivallales bacterium]